MDELVLQALERWPNVPAVRGWLRLDARGRWLIRQPPSATEKNHFAAVVNPQMIEFINRNYVVDDAGAYFQNGPQRVYVRPERGAFVWSYVDATSPALQAHTGQAVQTVSACWLDADEVPWLQTEWGAGHLLDRDLARWASELHSPNSADPLAALSERGAQESVWWRDLPVQFRN